MGWMIEYLELQPSFQRCPLSSSTAYSPEKTVPPNKIGASVYIVEIVSPVLGPTPAQYTGHNRDPISVRTHDYIYVDMSASHECPSGIALPLGRPAMALAVGVPDPGVAVPHRRIAPTPG